MKNELQILVEEIQREHDYLEKEMNTCIKESDFQGADAFHNSLIYTKQKLRILKNLENPNFDKINGLKRRIEYFKSIEVENELFKSSIERMKASIPALETELRSLEQTKPIFKNDSDELIIYLEKLLSGDLTFFELEIKENKLSIQINKNDNTLEIILSSLKNTQIKQHFIRYGVSELNNIGFTINESNAILRIEDFETSKIKEVIEILSRITFDILRLYGNQRAKIKY